MKVSVKTVDQVKVVDLDGELDGKTAPEVQEQLVTAEPTTPEQPEQPKEKKRVF